MKGMVYWYCADTKCLICLQGNLEIGLNLETGKIEQVWCAECAKNLLEEPDVQKRASQTSI